MRKLIVFNNLTLDGVMQAPGGADEDRRNGFEHGGWALPYQDEVMGQIAADGMAEGGPLLFGRWTYESFYSYWPQQTDNPYTAVLNQSQKYVASRTLSDPLPWENSTLLRGEAVDTVADIKKEAGKDIVVLGSGRLLETLILNDLVDQYTLLIHPLVLGQGQRMFTEGHHAALSLVDVKPTTTGVLIATYSPAD